MKYNKIALIGMMGSGKSTISKALQVKLNKKLIDLDNLFEEKNNSTISDFFKNFGEAEFRKKETELLKGISLQNDFILSCGGGIILSKENREILFNQDIYTIYLSANPDTIFNRIKSDTTRPLLQVNNPKKEIEKILNQRIKFYKLANLEIITDNKTIDEITDEIYEKYCN